jgi:hypothetical protein
VVYSRSLLFSGSTIPVVARFSVAGGNPNASDTEKSPRGMALEFRLANGSLQHMTMLKFIGYVDHTLDKIISRVNGPGSTFSIISR